MSIGSRSGTKQLRKEKNTRRLGTLKSDRVTLYFINQRSSEFTNRRIKNRGGQRMFSFEIVILKTRLNIKIINTVSKVFISKLN